MTVPAFSLLTCPPSYLHLAGARIHYHCLGEGPPLVLLHGLGSSSTDWFPITPGLAHRFRLILIDLRGHGQSSLALRGGYSLATMATDVVAVLDHLEIESSHVLGLSLGGCVALTLTINAPQRFRSMILVNTFARLRHAGNRMVGRRLTRLRAAMADRDVLAQQVAENLFADADRRAIAVRRLRQNDMRTLRLLMWTVARMNLLPALSHIQIPTLVLIGDRDTTVPRRCADDLMARLPNARLQVASGAGHALPYDQPEWFVERVHRFLP